MHPLAQKNSSPSLIFFAMSTAPAPAPATQPKAAVASPQEQLISHIRKYPLANSTRDLILAIPCARTVADSVTPSFQFVRNTYPINVAFDCGDKLADGLLDQLDKSIPSLQTLESRDLTDPVCVPLHEAQQAILKDVVEPTVKSVSEARYRLHSVISDNDGKSFILSYADPLMAPVNESIERFVEVWFPGSQKVSKDHSSELSRTVLIFGSVLTACRDPLDRPSEKVGAAASTVAK